MRKIIYAVTLLIGMVVASSCSYNIYPKSTLDFNYDMKMTTQEELETKSNIHIFLSDADIHNEYEVLAFVQYKPMIAIPIIAPERAQQLKKFYKKAVLKAQDLGGNGIIVTSVGGFKVIDIPALKEVPVTTAPVVSPIFRSVVLDKFENGAINSAEERQRVKYITMLEDEIESNLKACKTMEELDYISKKVDTLKNYYATSQKSTKAIEKKMQAYDASVAAVEKKIKARETKAGKKTTGVAEKVSSKVNKATSIFNKK